MYRINPTNQPIQLTASNLYQNNSNMKLSNLCTLLLQKADFANSVVFNNKEPVFTYQSSPYQNICKILGLKPATDDSETLDNIKDALRLKIFHKNIDTEELNTILEMTNSIPNDGSKDLFYKDICDMHLHKEDIDSALHVIKLIEDENISSMLLRSASFLLLDKRRFHNAVAVAKLIDNEMIKSLVFRKIAIEAAYSEDLSFCFNVIENIPESEPGIKKDALTTLDQFFLSEMENQRIKEVKLRYKHWSKLTKEKILEEFRR